MDDCKIKAYNEGYRRGVKDTESKHIETIRMLSDRIRELDRKCIKLEAETDRISAAGIGQAFSPD